MRGIFSRLSIGKKIIGLITTLLVLMVGVALNSYLKVHLASNEVIDLAQAIDPLTETISNIAADRLEEEVLFERIQRVYIIKPLDRARIAQEEKLLEKTASDATRESDDACRLVEEGIRLTSIKDEAVELARLQSQLKTLQQKHQEYYKQGQTILDALQKGDTKTASQLEAVLQAREDTFGVELDGMMEKLQQLNTQESSAVQKGETGVLKLAAENLIFTIGAFLAGIFLASMVTLRLVKPIRTLRDSARAVEEGDLNVEVAVTSGDEVGMLSHSFNSMISGLRAKEQIKSTFGQYVDPRIVETLLQNKGAGAEGQREVMTVFFSDVKGFSSISESLTPAALVHCMNQYYTLATEPIIRYQGVIDKYIGDAVMAFWGPPFTGKEDHAKLACLAALEQSGKLEELRRILPDLMGLRKGAPHISVRVGLCTGDVIVGNIGSHISRSYTVMGDTVNTASRLEGANKEYGTQILISEETYKLARTEIETREIDLIQVVGKSDPVRIFELLSVSGGLSQPLSDLRDEFEQGLDAYRERNWKLASRHFEACLVLDPSDHPSRLFLERLAMFQQTPPPSDWDGVWRLTRK